ncbi:hypothetical protein FOZ63_001399, partial [Perkinsus olseni]
MTDGCRRPRNDVEWTHVRGILRYLRLKGFSQWAARKELEDVCGFLVSLSFVAKVWKDVPEQGPKKAETTDRCQRWAQKDPSFWETVVFTDEKMWHCHEAERNKQNNRVWAQNVGD